jgi:glycerol-3-phosphate dehydrogenase
LRGGVIYYDGQFDDARLLINLVRTAADQGATLLNYARVIALTKDSSGYLNGAVFEDVETGTEHTVKAGVVINATGPFTDNVRLLDEPEVSPLISPSQGVHLIFDKSFLPGNSAIMVPHTKDGRVMFAVPYLGVTLVGTTDTPIAESSLEPRPLPEEIDFILETAGEYLQKAPSRDDILSVFTGIRPLVKESDNENTALISRDHTILISNSGLLTIAGGKWTTYRQMAEVCVNHAATLAGLESIPCVTKRLNIHGYHKSPQKFGTLALYGSDAPAIQDLLRSNASRRERLQPDFSVLAGEVLWATRFEAARTVDDFLARRTRCLILNAKAAMQAAPKVASLMAEELEKTRQWEDEQVESFRRMGKRYLPGI